VGSTTVLPPRSNSSIRVHLPRGGVASADIHAGRVALRGQVDNPDLVVRSQVGQLYSDITFKLEDLQKGHGQS
jgi:hypothetical protein